MIGEFTTTAGPWAHDWFLALVVRGTNRWIEFPTYAQGLETLCEELSNHLGSCVQVGLANRTDFTSRIMWPPKLVGCPLFAISSLRKGNFLRSIMSFIGQETGYCLSSEVLSAAGYNN